MTLTPKVSKFAFRMELVFIVPLPLKWVKTDMPYFVHKLILQIARRRMCMQTGHCWDAECCDEPSVLLTNGCHRLYATWNQNRKLMNFLGDECKKLLWDNSICEVKGVVKSCMKE